MTNDPPRSATAAADAPGLSRDPALMTLALLRSAARAKAPAPEAIGRTRGVTPGGRSLYYLIGTSGHPNYGDEMIAATWLRYLAEVAPDADVYLDCPAPGPAFLLLGDLHPRVKFVDTLWRLCWEASSTEPWQVNDFVQRAIFEPGIVPRWAAGVELLCRADVVHIIGGGYVNDIWPTHVGLVSGAVAATRKGGGRAVTSGAGLWPTAPHAGALLRQLATNFELFDVRDAPSATLVEGVSGVTRTGDDLFFGLDLAPQPPGADAPPVMICAQSDLVEVGVPGLADFLADTLREWKVTPDELGVIECIPGTDRRVWSYIERAFEGARFYSFAEIWRDGLPVSADQTWISTRFHPHLVAAAAGASGIAVSVSPRYYLTKHRSLIERGSRWTIVDDLTQVPERPTAGGFRPGQLDAFRGAKRELADAIYQPIRQPSSSDARGSAPDGVASIGLTAATARGLSATTDRTSDPESAATRGLRSTGQIPMPAGSTERTSAVTDA